MNKRIAKKRGAGKSFYETIETSTGPTLVHVNRRGCKGLWTEESAAALKDLVEAVKAHYAKEQQDKAVAASLEGSNNGE